MSNWERRILIGIEFCLRFCQLTIEIVDLFLVVYSLLIKCLIIHHLHGVELVLVVLAESLHERLVFKSLLKFDVKLSMVFLESLVLLNDDRVLDLY